MREREREGGGGGPRGFKFEICIALGPKGFKFEICIKGEKYVSLSKAHEKLTTLCNAVKSFISLRCSNVTFYCIF